ncbi:MAG: IS1595 family transposase [Maricaulaceae bacterium]|jgi:transposase-like protein
MKQTVQDFFRQFPDDEACLAHLFDVRFGQGHECPKCKRSAKWYRIAAERAFSCQWCGHHIHPTVGTPFEKSRTSLQLWFYAIFLFTKSRNGVAAKELERQLGVTYKCAWRMGHEIRKHMAEIDGDAPLEWHVEIDETYVGGVSKGKRGRGADKAIVFGMIERDGDVVTLVVPNARKATLQKLIVENVAPGATIYTDGNYSYAGLAKHGFTHKTIDKDKDGYARMGVHVNNIESFWRQLKAGINGTYIHVSSKHLSKYTKEFEFRFNRRACPERMLPELLSVFPS